MKQKPNVEFMPKATATVDLLHTLERLAARVRIPPEVTNLLTPVIEEALEARGVSARRATGEQLAKALGLSRPHRRTRSA